METVHDFVDCADDGYSCLRLVTRAERRVAASGATRETRARPVPSLPPPRGPPMCVKPGTPSWPPLPPKTPPRAPSNACFSTRDHASKRPERGSQRRL